MTLHIADIASYQGNLTVTQLRAAGFGGGNLKISHGLGLKSVHPKIERYTDFAVGTFHWLTKDASGTAQAEHAYARMRALRLTDVAHTVDVESDGLTERIYRDYLIRMTWLLQRSILTYSGKWWANSRFWLRSSAESPWLWSAPGKGYVPAYPGDSSPLWDDGYAGWDTLAVMQYRVAKVAGIEVSQSAVRDLNLWGGIAMADNSVPASDVLLAEFNYIGPKRSKASDGTIGDTAHANDSSDHNPDETGRTPFEDSDSINEVHARDVTDAGPWLVGWSVQRAINIILERCRSGQEKRLQNIIYNRKIWSRSTGWEQRDYNGSNPHDKHAHFSFRYGSGAAPGNPEKITTPYGIAAAAKAELEPEKEEVPEVAFADEKIKLTATAGTELFEPDRAAGSEVEAATVLQLAAIHARRAALSTDTVEATLATLGGLVQALVSRDDVDETALAEALVPGLAAAVLAGLPEGALTGADVEQAVRNVLRDGVSA